ncbi:MAG: hypothetical protein AAF597_02400, partial [Bacteroidota bacterium]
MRLFFLTLIVLALVASNELYAQGKKTAYSIPKSVPGAYEAEAVTAGGYFILRPKANRLSPQQWLQQHQDALGLSAKMVLVPQRETTAIDGRNYLRLQQHYLGAPVLGGDLIAQRTASGAMNKLSGYLA